jgi:probable rRNA maturation factor
MISFDVLTRRPSALTARDLERVASAVTRGLKLKGPVSVSLSFVSEPAMRRLNKEQMHKDRPTDVLAFPMDALFVPPGEARSLGDLVVCPVYAEREARRRAIPPKEELARLIIHGTLHLVGYDHDTPAKESRMFALQERMLESAFRL